MSTKPGSCTESPPSSGRRTSIDSLRHSYEINVLLLGGEIPPQLDGLFEEDLAASRRIDAAVLSARGVFERAVDTVAALLVRLI